MKCIALFVSMVLLSLSTAFAQETSGFMLNGISFYQKGQPKIDFYLDNSRLAADSEENQALTLAATERVAMEVATALRARGFISTYWEKARDVKDIWTLNVSQANLIQEDHEVKCSVTVSAVATRTDPHIDLECGSWSEAYSGSSIVVRVSFNILTVGDIHIAAERVPTQLLAMTEQYRNIKRSGLAEVRLLRP